jgi:hypothetical protein
VRQRDECVVIRSTGANTRRLLKDGYHDRRQNYVEYLALMLGPGTRLKPVPTDE